MVVSAYRFVIMKKKTEIRAVIEYIVKKGMKAKEIHADFQSTLGALLFHIQLVLRMGHPLPNVRVCRDFSLGTLT